MPAPSAHAPQPGRTSEPPGSFCPLWSQVYDHCAATTPSFELGSLTLKPEHRTGAGRLRRGEARRLCAPGRKRKHTSIVGQGWVSEADRPGPPVLLPSPPRKLDTSGSRMPHLWNGHSSTSRPGLLWGSRDGPCPANREHSESLAFMITDEVCTRVRGGGSQRSSARGLGSRRAGAPSLLPSPACCASLGESPPSSTLWGN